MGPQWRDHEIVPLSAASETHQFQLKSGASISSSIMTRLKLLNARALYALFSLSVPSVNKTTLRGGTAASWLATTGSHLLSPQFLHSDVAVD